MPTFREPLAKGDITCDSCSQQHRSCKATGFFIWHIQGSCEACSSDKNECTWTGVGGTRKVNQIVANGPPKAKQRIPSFPDYRCYTPSAFPELSMEANSAYLRDLNFNSIWQKDLPECRKIFIATDYDIPADKNLEQSHATVGVTIHLTDSSGWLAYTKRFGPPVEAYCELGYAFATFHHILDAYGCMFDLYTRGYYSSVRFSSSY